MEPLMTSDEVAEFLRVDVVTIRRLVNRGDLSAYRVGSEYRFTQADLKNYLLRQRISGDDLAAIDIVQQAGGISVRDRFDKFTERTRKVFTLAQQEAKKLRHAYIGTEHLLLGIIDEGEGVAAQVLKNMDLDLEQVRTRVESFLKEGKSTVLGEVGLTPRAKKAVELAVDEAKRLSHHYIGTEHLLLGLIRIGEGIASDALKSLNVDMEKATAETLQILNSLIAKNLQSPPTEASSPQAPSPLKEGEQGQTCPHCGVQTPTYFQYCHNCGNKLSQ